MAASLPYQTVENYKELKPNTQYKLSASVRYPDLVFGGLAGTYIGTNIPTPAEYIIQSNRYERIERIFISGSNPDHITDLLIEASSTLDMLFDDITLVELGPSPFGKVRAHFSANGRSINYNFQSALPGEHRFEIFMNGEKKSNLEVDLLVFGLNLTTPTNNLNISSEEATNPSNTFEIRFKGDPLVTFKGSNG